MFIFYPQAYFYDDAFFGADSWRVENDITLIDEGHWRLNVHPLFVMLVQPIFHILNGVINNNLLTILLMQATLGALLVTFVYEILCDFNVLLPLRLVMISIFGMGASQLIWSAIPETFLYGALALCSFWWFLIKRAGLRKPKNNGAFNKWEILVLVFFGVVSCGLTITNVFFFILGVAFFVKSRSDQPFHILVGLAILVITALLFVLLCAFQSFSWPGADPFWSTLFTPIIEDDFEAEWVFRFGSWSIDANRIPLWLSQTVLFPVLAPEIYSDEVGLQIMGHGTLRLGDYTPLLTFAIVLFVVFTIVVVAIKLFHSIKGIANKSNSHEEDIAFLFLFMSWIVGIGMHYFYDYREAFLFSPHFFYIYILLVSLSINHLIMTNKALIKPCLLFLCFFLMIEIVNNLLMIRDVVLFTHFFSQVAYRPLRSFVLSIFIGILALGVGASVKCCFSEASVIEFVSRMISIYLLILLISSTFIMFSYTI